jgi:hypothetical protein
MGTITKLNNVLCANISKVDDILKANASKWDDNTFCPSVSPTPTPTPSPAVNCRQGTVADLASYSFWDCCGVYFEGSGEPGFQACFDANRLNSGISNDASCTQSCVTPTPTPTITPTPTPVPCERGCCFVELCYSERDCTDACQCNDLRGVYLSQPCYLDPCELAYADGIYKNDGCTDPAEEGYYSDNTNCYLWQSGILTIQGTC